VVNLNNRLREVLKKEQAHMEDKGQRRLERMQATIAKYMPPDSAGADHSLLKQLESALCYFTAPWYRRWWHRSDYNVLQEGYARLKMIDEIESLLEQLGESDELVIQDESPKIYIQAARAIAMSRRYDSIWNISRWWQKRQTENQLTQAGKRMKKHLETKHDLLSRWEGLCRQIKEEATQLIGPLIEKQTRHPNDFFDQVERDISLESFYRRWIEESFEHASESQGSNPGWLGRYHWTMDKQKQYVYIRQLIRLLELINHPISQHPDSEDVEQEIGEKIEPSSADSKEFSGIRLSYAQDLLESLLRQGLYLSQAQAATRQGSEKVWRLYRQLGEGIVELALLSEKKQFSRESKGVIGWCQRVAEWLPEILPKSRKGRLSWWKRNAHQNAPETSHLGWINQLETWLGSDCYPAWLHYQEKCKAIEQDYEEQVEKESCAEHYAAVQQAKAELKLRLHRIISAGIEPGFEPAHLDVMLEESHVWATTLLEAVVAYWSIRGRPMTTEGTPSFTPYQAASASATEGRESKGKEKQLTSGVLDQIEGVKESMIMIKLGPQGLECCRILGLEPNDQGEIEWSQIKEQYRQRVKQSHPDRSGSSHPDDFIKVNEAYKIIKGIKEGNLDIGCIERNSQFYQDPEKERRELAEIEAELEELKAGFQEIRRVYERIDERRRRMDGNIEKIQEWCQENHKENLAMKAECDAMHEVFAEIRAGYAEVREGLQKNREQFEKAEESHENIKQKLNDVVEVAERIEKMQEKASSAQKIEEEKKENRIVSEEQTGRQHITAKYTPQFWQQQEEIPQAVGKNLGGSAYKKSGEEAIEIEETTVKFPEKSG
jgi:hypothetical protein